MKTFKQHINEGIEGRPDPRVIQSQSFAPPAGDLGDMEIGYIEGGNFDWGITDNVYERELVRNLVGEYGKYLDEPPSDLDGVIAIALEKADDFEDFGGHSQLLKIANEIIDEIDEIEEKLISDWRKGNWSDWMTSLRLNALERFKQRIRSGIIEVLQPEEL